MMDNKLNIDKYTTDYHEQLMHVLQKKRDAKAYLQVALEEYEHDNDARAFMQALRNVVDAQGGVNQISKKTDLNRQNLYRMLSPKGNPRLSTLWQLLHALGFKLSIA